MGYATVAAVQTGLATQASLRVTFLLSGLATPTANTIRSYWPAAGMRPAGTYPAAGLGSAVTVSSATAGAMNLNMPNAAVSKNWWLLQARLAHVASSIVNDGGVYWLVDRLAHATVAANQATGPFSPVIDGTARLAAGEGAMIVIEQADGTTPAGNVVSLTYTDQGGAAGTTPNVTLAGAAGPIGRVAYSLAGLFVPLAADDRGARTITDWTLVSGAATGALGISLVRPLAQFQAPLLYGLTSLDRDWVVQMSGMAKILDGTALVLYRLIPSATNSVEIGELVLGMN